MPGFSDFSTNEALNVTIGGINVAENCPAANVNNAIRYVLREGKELSNIVAAISTSSLMPKAGGTFTGPILRGGAGAYLYHISSSMTGGGIAVQTSGTALPLSPAEGTFVFQY